MLGRYKQWNGLLEWNTGLDHWTELFSFFGQASKFIFGRLLFYDLQVSGYVLWMIVIMTTVAY